MPWVARTLLVGCVLLGACADSHGAEGPDANAESGVRDSGARDGSGPSVGEAGMQDADVSWPPPMVPVIDVAPFGACADELHCSRQMFCFEWRELQRQGTLDPETLGCVTRDRVLLPAGTMLGDARQPRCPAPEELVQDICGEGNCGFRPRCGASGWNWSSDGGLAIDGGVDGGMVNVEDGGTGSKTPGDALRCCYLGCLVCGV